MGEVENTWEYLWKFFFTNISITVIGEFPAQDFGDGFFKKHIFMYCTYEG